MNAYSLTARVRASSQAIELIKRFEGCRLTAYEDQGGVWTVGWGTTGPGINERTTVSQGVANGMLLGDISRVSQDISQLVGIAVNQNQFDALVSFVYNLGIGAFKSSTLLKLILAYKKQEAADEILRWDHINGVVIPGLLFRREAERALFLT